MEYHMYQFLLFLLCPIVYASDIPQRFFPGTFDIVGKLKKPNLRFKD